MIRRPGRGIAAAAGLIALAAAASGCGGTAAPPRSSTRSVSAPPVPLNTSIATTAGTWATVVMGGSAAQYNDFWQLFIRPAGTTQWKLATPPGTADNGGLVLAVGAHQTLVTAVRPSQNLTYTPLAQTGDSGRSWSSLSPLDAALASTPDSLAVEPGSGRLLALLGTGTAEQADDAGTSWTTLVTARALSATAAGRACGLRALTAIASSPADTPLLAGTCSVPGVAGIFSAAGQTWQPTGPTLTGAFARRPVTVLRLVTAGDQITALLASGSGHSTSVLAAWSADNGARWTLSPPLATIGRPITTASLGPGQAVAVITDDGGVVLGAGQWHQLPALPAGTTALAPGADGDTDALAVHHGTLTVWQVTSSAASWTKTQTINVPILYGSSS